MVTVSQQKAVKKYGGKDTVYGIRAEHMILNKKTKGVFSGKVSILELFGDIMHCYVYVGSNAYILKVNAFERIKKGEEIIFSPNTELACLFDKKTGLRIK